MAVAALDVLDVTGMKAKRFVVSCRPLDVVVEISAGNQ
jgi:hypothetical protein